MLLGMPCVTADVGGIPSLFVDGEDGILYEGYRIGKTLKNSKSNLNEENEKQLKAVSKRLANAVIEMWKDPVKQAEYCQNARKHAGKTHSPERNYRKLMEIYAKIITDEESDDDRDNDKVNDKDIS